MLASCSQCSISCELVGGFKLCTLKWELVKHSSNINWCISGYVFRWLLFNYVGFLKRQRKLGRPTVYVDKLLFAEWSRKSNSHAFFEFQNKTICRKAQKKNTKKTTHQFKSEQNIYLFIWKTKWTKRCINEGTEYKLQFLLKVSVELSCNGQLKTLLLSFFQFQDMILGNFQIFASYNRLNN